jgi:hypothetical protein
MSQLNLERLRTRRANIGRYRKLLETRLTDLERAYLERRLSEEQASAEALLQEMFPERLCLSDKSTGPTEKLEMAALLHQPGYAK